MTTGRQMLQVAPLISVRDQTYEKSVISELDNGYRAGSGHAVVCVQ